MCSYHHGDLPPALVAAATQLLDEGGPPAVTIAELSRRTGVSAADPYRHYVNREVLLTELASVKSVVLVRQMRRAQRGNAERRLIGATVSYVERLGEDAGLFDLHFASGLSQTMQPCLWQFLSVLEEPARELVNGQITARHLATAVGVVAHGYATMQPEGMFTTLNDVSPQLIRTLKALLSGRAAFASRIRKR
jgi:AcrR family transcriptional regulator